MVYGTTMLLLEEKNIKYDFNIFYSADAVVWLRTTDI